MLVITLLTLPAAAGAYNRGREGHDAKSFFFSINSEFSSRLLTVVFV
jgi:hypothetical protein